MTNKTFLDLAKLYPDAKITGLESIKVDGDEERKRGELTHYSFMEYIAHRTNKHNCGVPLKNDKIHLRKPENITEDEKEDFTKFIAEHNNRNYVIPFAPIDSFKCFDRLPIYMACWFVSKNIFIHNWLFTEEQLKEWVIWQK